MDHLNNNNNECSYELNYYDLMETALMLNRPQFFQLFLDQFQANPELIKNFITSKRLYFLYNFKNDVSFKIFNNKD